MSTGQHRHHHSDPGEDEKAYHWHLHDDHGKLVSALPTGMDAVHKLSIESGGLVTAQDMERWEPVGFVHGDIEWRVSA